jgi:nucleoside 2-deoxyribosyltransferase
MKVYLAGPGVFLPFPKEYGERKKAICAAYGFKGIFPLDSEIHVSALSPFQMGAAISYANENLMRDCDLIIADMTPFRGISMDCGTSFEMGFMRALLKPVLGYSNVAADFFSRAQQQLGPAVLRDPLGRPQAEGLALEDFGMSDNLMLHGAVYHSGFAVLAEDVPADERYTSLIVFEKVVRLAAGKFMQVESGRSAS